MVGKLQRCSPPGGAHWRANLAGACACACRSAPAEGGTSKGDGAEADLDKDVDDEAEPSSAAEVQGTASSEDKYFVPLRLACESKLPRVMEVPPPQ